MIIFHQDLWNKQRKQLGLYTTVLSCCIETGVITFSLSLLLPSFQLSLLFSSLMSSLFSFPFSLSISACFSFLNCFYEQLLKLILVVVSCNVLTKMMQKPHPANEGITDEYSGDFPFSNPYGCQLFFALSDIWIMGITIVTNQFMIYVSCLHSNPLLWTINIS